MENHDKIAKEIKLERRSDLVLRKAIITLTKAFSDSLGTLEQHNQEILDKIDDIQHISVASQVNRVKFLLEHEKLYEGTQTVLENVNKTVAGLSVQIQALNSELNTFKKNKSG